MKTHHGKWSEGGVPHTGWSCHDMEDLGPDNTEVCDMCEVTEIRFVHIMGHPDYPDSLRCGCVCAGRMEENKVRARGRERDIQKRAGRRRRFPSLKWKTSKNGNQYLNKDGFHIVIFSKKRGFGFVIEELGSKWNHEYGLDVQVVVRKRWNETHYQTDMEAKMGAFDELEAMKGGK